MHSIDVYKSYAMWKAREGSVEIMFWRGVLLRGLELCNNICKAFRNSAL